MTIIPNVTVVIQIATFLILMLALDALLFKPMMRVLNERKARTVGRREVAAAASTQADQIWKDYQAKLAEARAEADKIRLELVRQGEAERNRITETAAAQADKTVADVKARVADESAKVRRELIVQIDGLGREMAEKIIGRAV